METSIKELSIEGLFAFKKILEEKITKANKDGHGREVLKMELLLSKIKSEIENRIETLK